MIKSIHIKNYILIDDLTIDFSNGLNVITGETGAGKSILLNAIDIAFGAKATSDLIKKGCDKALIELFVSTKENLRELLETNGIEFDNEISVVREITQSASRIRINGTIVNQNFVKELREQVLDIHSQHQTYSFLQPKSHITLLDNYAKEFYGQDLEYYKELYKKYQKILKQLESSKQSLSITESEIDFLKFQINEIDEAKIEDIEEDSKLKQELDILQNAEKLKELTYSSYKILNSDEGSILDALLQVKSNITKAANTDSNLESIESQITDLTELTRDLSANLRDYTQTISADENRLNEIQERLYTFDKLKRKYGSTLENIMKTYDELSNKLNSIEFSSKNIEELENELEKITKELNDQAETISENRKNYALVLSALIEDELEKLELPKSRFEIRINKTNINQNGTDDVEFYISTNISQDLTPLAKTASGGEISRVMLAIKTIFAKADEIDTVIFDEIDTGISGKAAQAVAEEISALSKYRQIILITHQAIIAAKSDLHLFVEKIQGNETFVNIKALDENEKISAIASLTSGSETEEALKFAKSLLSDK